MEKNGGAMCIVRKIKPFYFIFSQASFQAFAYGMTRKI
jgi:hypothetical protein